MFNNALSCQPMSVERDRILIYSELRLKFPVVMREMLEEEQPLFCCGKSWGDFWVDLEKPPKKKGSEAKESGRGGAVGGGGKGGGEVNRGGRQEALQGRIAATVVAQGNTGQTVVTTQLHQRSYSRQMVVS